MNTKALKRIILIVGIIVVALFANTTSTVSGSGTSGSGSSGGGGHTHSGGTATCITKKKCSSCGQYYGSYNSSNHEGSLKTTYTYKNESQHDYVTKYTCCGVVTSSGTQNHSGHGGTWTADTYNHWTMICDYCNANYAKESCAPYYKQQQLIKSPTCTAKG